MANNAVAISSIVVGMLGDFLFYLCLAAKLPGGRWCPQDYTEPLGA
jgi:hypothetical protein